MKTLDNLTATVDATAIGVIRLLASFSATGDIHDLSKARSEIRELALAEVDIALPLWDVTLWLQRSLTDIGDGE